MYVRQSLGVAGKARNSAISRSFAVVPA